MFFQQGAWEILCYNRPERKAALQSEPAIKEFKMRTCFSLVMVFLFGFSVGTALAAPNLKIDESTYDFGEVYQGEKVLHTFAFENTGDEPLVIDRVRSSCGCTAVLLSAKNLAPGSQGEVQANFDSTRFRGKVQKTIYLYSNDPNQPVMQLHIKGTVLEIVKVTPTQVNFGHVTLEERLSTQVVLRNQSDGPLTFGKPTTTAEELRAEMPETSLAKGEEVSIALTLTLKPGTGRFSGYVLIPVEGVPQNELRIPVYASLKK